jgi:hypothetical protein
VHAVLLTPYAHVHVVSLTPHARCMRCHWHTNFFEQLRRVKIICKTAMVYTKQFKMHAVSLTPHEKYYTASKIRHRMHDRRTIRTALAASKGNIYNIYVLYLYMFPNCPTPPLKKYINLKGLPNKKVSCMRCHWQRMHDFCVGKSIISRRIRSRIQKGFSPWIRGPGGIVWWKKPRVENPETLSLSQNFAKNSSLRFSKNIDSMQFV